MRGVLFLNEFEGMSGSLGGWKENYIEGGKIRERRRAGYRQA